MGSSDERDECRLLDGPVAYLAQVFLFGFVLGSLLIKRSLESPKRPMKVWAMDVSKQAFSSIAAHLCNMLIAILASVNVRASSSSECSWYFVVYTIDTTIGVSLTILLHRLIIRGAQWLQQNRYEKLQPEEDTDSMWKHAVQRRWFDYIATCGNYGNPPSMIPWIWQMGEWTLVTVIARGVCGTLVVTLGQYGLVSAAGLLDDIFDNRPDLLLLFVMVMCPILMNLVQAWVQDAVLKWRRMRQGFQAQGFVEGEVEVISIVEDGWSDKS
ncbi:hypothetical protein BSKO_05351 [Bryopsis sp. KO-2023]|nr:hypothetical protein BSKO_05351 [Bryopsis sp. KO-2023]